MAQDVGAHRKKVYTATPTIEEELWKRAFWCVVPLISLDATLYSCRVLVSMDRSISSALGRPCAIQDEDFDLDLPTECDDEYWNHPDPNLAWKQPSGKASIVTFFNCFLRLNQILAFALRTIVSSLRHRPQNRVPMRALLDVLCDCSIRSTSRKLSLASLANNGNSI